MSPAAARKGRADPCTPGARRPQPCPCRAAAELDLSRAIREPDALAHAPHGSPAFHAGRP